MKKLVLIDHFLIGKKGHEEQYDYSIAKEAQKRGIPVEVWCPINSQASQESFVKPCLMRPFWLRKNPAAKLLSAIRSIFEWRKLLTDKAFDKDTIVLIENVRPIILLLLLLALVGLKLKPKVVVVLRRTLNKLLVYLLKRKQILLFSDSELISEQINAETLPIPHMPPRNENLADNNKIVIGYFGEARFDKGFNLLADLVRLVLAETNKMSFIVQVNIHKPDKLIERAYHQLKELKQANPGQLEIVDRYLSDDEYVSLMRKCSIILIPYRKKYYGLGTSGILAEAIANGSWAVVPKGTWMAEQKHKYDRIIEFAEPTPEALLQAISYCSSKNISVDKSKLKQQIDRWYEFHSPKKYIEILQTI